jgi:hypothetical protein
MGKNRTIPPRAAYVGIFLISAATLLLQVTFTRIFSVSIWYHFAFLVVSVALFGFGASGVALSLVPESKRDAVYRSWAPALFGLTAVVAYLGTNVIPFSPFRIAQVPVQALYFLLYDLLLTTPFFFAGATVALILRGYPSRAGKLYAFDLVGAAVGTLIVFLALPLLGAPGTIVLAGAIGVASAAFLSTSHRQRLILIGVGLVSVPFLAEPSLIPDVRIDVSKPVTAEVNQFGGKLVFSKWNALSRIDVVEKANSNPIIFIDAAAATEIAPRRNLGQSRQDVSTVAYALKEKPSVVIIGSGGGIDVQNAITLGASSVTAVEINSIINYLVTRRYKDYVNNVFTDPRVVLVRDEGRSYIARSDRLFDVIQITLTDTWAASVSGAYSLSENYLYTTEAFKSYLEHLTPDGYVSITRWHYESPRLVALGRAALEDMGITNASPYILVLQDGVRHLFLMKRKPFTGEEMRRVRVYAKQSGKVILHDPVSPAGTTFFDVFLAAADTKELVDINQMALTPVSDDSPFFFQMVRWKNLKLDFLTKFRGKSILDPLVVPVGQMALIAALGLGILLSVVLLAIPIFKKAVPRAGRIRWLGYFVALGLSYIIVEVVLMQRLGLFLGHPTYSVTTVLFAILLFSGLGSAWSDRRHGSTADVVRPVLWLLPVAIILLVFAVPPLMRALIGLPHAARLAIAMAIIAPVAFLMGVPFPAGIRAVGASDSKHIPWAWAANGCASVIGSVCAVLGAMAWNFSVMLLIAGVIYLLALMGITRMRIDLA